MSEQSESPTNTAAITTSSGRPCRLSQVALWVSIVAGVVFIVATVFFSGFLAGVYSAGEGYWYSGYGHQQWRRGYDCTMNSDPMGSGGMMGPGMMGPGQSSPAPHHS